MALKRGRRCLISDPISSNSNAGQMTIEFVVAFPVALVIALVAINALLFSRSVPLSIDRFAALCVLMRHRPLMSRT